ncbi:MAG: cation:proton antiporter [Deltaproteobacteria bacterium]|nr:cation:proton antiporter [Deltaproteobacteria bacterium]
MIAALILVLVQSVAFGAGAGPEKGAVESGPGLVFLWIAVILLAATFSNYVIRFGQPAVLGELMAGILLGNLSLLGFHFFDGIQRDSVIRFLAELGVVVLLFQVGLESNVQRMLRVGLRAFLVACVGVIAPFMLGTLVIGPWLLPELSFNAHLFLGAILTATSVGISARVFHDLGKLQTIEAQIVLGAAVIDDVLGLIILAVVKASVESGSVGIAGIGWVTLKAVLFLGCALFVGNRLAPGLGRLLSRINPGVGMKFTLAVVFGLTFAYLADLMGLAPIVGAFAAGLVLDPVHFRHFQKPLIVEEVDESIRNARPEVKTAVSHVLEAFSHSHVEDLIKPLGYFLVPIFFVITGMQVRLEAFLNLPVLVLALTVTAAAVAGKMACSLVAGRVSRGIVGWGMVPRGEVGLIFAMTGKTLGVIPDEIFAMVIIVIMLTTILPAPILSYLLKQQHPCGVRKERDVAHGLST